MPVPPNFFYPLACKKLGASPLSPEHDFPNQTRLFVPR